MRKKTRTIHREGGAVLIAGLVIVVAITALAAITLSRASNNVTTYQENSRKQLSERTAESALEKAMGQINKLMKTHDEAGDMHGQLFEYTSRERSHASGLGPVLIDDPDFSDMVGNTNRDQINNSGNLVASGQDEDGNLYRGGIYRVSIEEWNDDPSGPDEYGTVHLDEPMEIKKKSQEGSRRFSVRVEAAYGNYMTELWGFIGTEPRDGFGMFGSDSLSVGNNLDINSFRSIADNPYVSAYRGKGNIGSEGPVSIGSNTEVHGLAEYGTTYTNKGTVHGTPSGDPRQLLAEPEEQTYESNNYSQDKYNFVGVLGNQTFGSGSPSGITQVPPGHYDQLQINGQAEVLSGPVKANELVVNGELENPNGGEIVVKNDMVVQSGSTFENTGGDLYIQNNYQAGDNVQTVMENPDSASDPMRVEVQGDSSGAGGNGTANAVILQGQGGGNNNGGGGGGGMNGNGLIFEQKNYVELEGDIRIFSRDLMAGNGFQMVTNSGDYNFDPLTYEEGGYVELQLDGDVQMDPGGGSADNKFATSPIKPPALKMRVGGDVFLYPRGRFSMDLMAPNGTVTLKPHSQNDKPVRGRIYAQNVDLSNNIKFEYDLTLPSIMGHYTYRAGTLITNQRGGPRP